MHNLKSRFVSLINYFLIKFRKSIFSFCEKSFFLSNIDNIIFALMIILFFFSLFASSGVLGFIANVIFALTVLKVVFKSSKRIRLSNVSLALFVYLVFVFISTINSTAVASSFSGMLKTMTYIGFYFSSVVFSERQHRKIACILHSYKFFTFV